MSRQRMFPSEAVDGLRGLASLTEPRDDEAVGAIVDVAVIGARGDGKTQFIVHAIRTLRAYAPPLDGAEHQYNRDVLQVVMDARTPRPEATAPGVIPHYVFRIRPDSLLAHVGSLGRFALYARVAGLWSFLLLALVNAALVGAVLGWLRGGLDAAAIAASVLLFAAGIGLGFQLSRRRFLTRGDIELVFWDVAGEHVYSSSAADYYSFLSALVRTRRSRASATRSYAFAPVLLCNPVSLGTRAEGSSYARLRQLIPLFASLNEPLARAMVAINRWAVVQEICAPDSDREELVAIAPRARAAPGEEEEEGAEGHQGSDDSEGGIQLARPVLPVVKRDVVRKHCLDAEDGDDSEVHFSYLRYDAGIQCEFRSQSWQAWDALEGEVRSRWRAPTASSPQVVLDYIYEDGPGSFTGEVRRAFLNWVAALAFDQASYGSAIRGAGQEEGAGEMPAIAEMVKSMQAKEQRAGRASEGPREAKWAAQARASSAERPSESSAERAGDVEDVEDEAIPLVKKAVKRPAAAAPPPVQRPAAAAPPAAPRAASSPPVSSPVTAKPLSAKGLEEFAKGTIAPAVLPTPGAEEVAVPASGLAAAARDDAAPSRPARRRGNTEPGIGITVREYSARPATGRPVTGNERRSEPAGETVLMGSDSSGAGPHDQTLWMPIEAAAGGEGSQAEPAPTGAGAAPSEGEGAEGDTLRMPEDESRGRSHGETLRMPGGFGSGGT